MTETKTLGQHRLAIELRLAADQAMTVDPLRGPNRSAMRKVKRLLADHPDALKQSHVKWNLGTRRVEWLTAVRDGR